MSDREEIRQNVIKWIEALRGVHYQQTRGSLRVDNSYCCLGVGVDILYGIDVWIENIDADGLYYYGDGFESEVLYPEDREEFGLSVDDENVLTKMNDAGIPFPEIADWIRENVLSRLEDCHNEAGDNPGIPS